jgi:hypothetical protein
MATDDFCLVCTEPLHFTAYGPCGHTETCSKCVSRLRSVLKDSRCAYCQQEQPAVFVCRYAGDYTTLLGPEAFEKLEVCTIILNKYSMVSISILNTCKNIF